MDKSGRKTLSDNIARIWKSSGLQRSTWAKSYKLAVKPVERAEKDEGTKGVGLGVLDEIAAKLKLEPWQLLVPNLALDAPPVLSGDAPKRMTGGAAALLLAQSFADAPDRARHHVASLISEMIENGPDESQASAIDALATIDVLVPSGKSPERRDEHPLMGEFLDLDQDVLEAVRHVARLSQTMTTPQRRAMVAALRDMEETTWHTSPEESSGRTVRIPEGRLVDRPTYKSTGKSVQTSKKVTK